MSVMLRTTNPEAAGEEAHDRRVPYIGQVVVYHCRPGEARQGRMEVAAIVEKIEDEDHLELLVLHSAEDLISKWKIARHGDQNPFNSWSFNAWDEEHYQPNKAVELPVEKESGAQLTWEDVKEMYKEIGVLRAANVTLAERVAELEKGDTAEAPVKASRKTKI